MTHFVQIHDGSTRAVAAVDGRHLRLLHGADSVYEAVISAALTGVPLPDWLAASVTDQRVDYDEVYDGRSSWRLLPPIDHPTEPARCLVSGTGLTHLGSAADRQRMHEASASEMTDSMRMFQLGIEGGKPADGRIGAAPEWFYKGTGVSLRAHGDPLDVPAFAEDGGEEGEVAGLYVVDRDGVPRRVGMAVGNEFSDHVFEKRNYLNLAGSKLRTCSLGPELVIHPEFRSVDGRVSITRDGADIWSRAIVTGEDAMSHSLANIEHHHFKFDAHRRPGDVHVHYFGACALSFGDGVRLADGDVMQVQFSGFGRALRNPVRVTTGGAARVTVRA
jgi:hypothetical protein